MKYKVGDIVYWTLRNNKPIKGKVHIILGAESPYDYIIEFTSEHDIISAHENELRIPTKLERALT